MMKAKELMIGSLIKAKSGAVGKVIHLTHCTINAMPEGSFEPIPLTPEILKLNGFVYNGLQYTKVYKAFRHVLVIIDADLSNIEINFIDGYGTDYEECAYASMIELDKNMSVHEVQHALHLCGLTELAYNFKVKGE